MRFKPTFLDGISSEMLHSFHINSLHILNSGDLPPNADIVYFFTETVLSEEHKKWSPNECFSHLSISLLPGKSVLVNDKIVRSFDLCFSALS